VSGIEFFEPLDSPEPEPPPPPAPAIRRPDWVESPVNVKAFEHAVLPPRFTAPRVGDHDHLVGVEVAKLVSVAHIAVSDSSKAEGASPRAPSTTRGIR
jgi:hypothetical protein